jgi:uncharacterized protein (DUF302 family)
MTLSKEKGIIDTPSNHTVDQTVERLKGILSAKGVTLFALIDHSGEAEKVGMKMPPTKLLIFGSPKAGTPVMLAAPSLAIDLPLKILVWEDSQGKGWVSYNSPEYRWTFCRALRQREHWPPRPPSRSCHPAGWPPGMRDNRLLAPARGCANGRGQQSVPNRVTTPRSFISLPTVVWGNSFVAGSFVL